MPRGAGLLAVHPVLSSTDVERSLAFYRRLGFVEAFRDRPQAPSYAGVVRDGVELHLQWHADASTPDGDRPVYRVTVHDVDALHAEFAAAGALPDERAAAGPYARPSHTPWGTYEFHLRDPDRNGLQFYAGPAGPVSAAPRRHLSRVALVVRDYDEAIDWYRRALGFHVVEDTEVPEQAKRWVVVAPEDGARGSGLLLARAASPEQARFIGDQAGGRVFLFLRTDDFARDEARLRAAGARFVRPPRDEPYGRVAVFEDLYGNRWDLLGPPPAA